MFTWHHIDIWRRRLRCGVVLVLLLATVAPRTVLCLGGGSPRPMPCCPADEGGPAVQPCCGVDTAPGAVTPAAVGHAVCPLQPVRGNPPVEVCPAAARAAIDLAPRPIDIRLLTSVYLI